MSKDTTYDVAVIGGGAAGMMAAGRAAECGARVILIEKNSTLGKKLLITGGGRCNVTNYELDTRKFLEKFKDNKKFLFSPFSFFSVKETLDFFNSKGMETKVEANNRVFPLSNSATSVFNVLVEYMKKYNVTVLKNASVKGFTTEDNRITSILLRDKKVVQAKNYILATGGKSHPETGSTGDGFTWLSKIGHTVSSPSAALVPITTQEKWVHRLSGVSLENIKLTTFLNNKPQSKHKGKILFTHFGLSGPMILNMSKDLGELLKYGDVTLLLDLLPHLDIGTLDKTLQSLLLGQQNKKIKNTLSPLIPSAVAPIVIEISGIDENKAVNTLSRDERIKLVSIIKNMPITVTGLMGEDKAIITSGGVALEEVDTKTMRSKKYDNLFLVGDILNIDRPSGGYSLQLCWTTGYIAGGEAVK